ncbi:MAG: hypothetical protein ACI9LM_005476 [Alteromonadaceae bacterium]|jgi:hypothetical protein
MNIGKAVLALLKRPTLIAPSKHIILLSHMRANTSLIGHILGSHPEISGYYEMHIGYFSWKSLFRQKLEFQAAHEQEACSPFYFDKVLHSEHYINTNLFNPSRAIAIFSLRNPKKTIPSIVKLYEGVDPEHVFCTIAGAAEYYIERVNTLASMAKQFSGQYYYYDAEAIKEKTDDTLTFLTASLGLTSPLQKNYKSQNNTGKGDSGDHSENLTKGYISQANTDYSTYEIPKELLEKLEKSYQVSREIIIKHAKATIENREYK